MYRCVYCHLSLKIIRSHITWSYIDYDTIQYNVAEHNPRKLMASNRNLGWQAKLQFWPRITSWFAWERNCDMVSAGRISEFQVRATSSILCIIYIRLLVQHMCIYAFLHVYVHIHIRMGASRICKVELTFFSSLAPQHASLTPGMQSLVSEPDRGRCVGKYVGR